MMHLRIVWPFVAALWAIAAIGTASPQLESEPPPLNDETTEEKLARLEAMIEGESRSNVPPGTIVAYGGPDAPAGWRLCNGTELPIDDYNDLYDAIGASYGTASKPGFFKLPDLRGMFLRGAGGERGAPLGKYQEWATGRPKHKDFRIRISESGSHSHGIDANGGRAVRFLQVAGRAPGNGHNTPSGLDGHGEEISCKWDTCSRIRVESDGVHAHEASIHDFDGETRPDNCSVQFIIKLGRVTGSSEVETRP